MDCVKTVEECLGDLDFPVEDGDECWEEDGYLYLHSPVARTIYMVDPKGKRFCHRGTGRGVFIRSGKIFNYNFKRKAVDDKMHNLDRYLKSVFRMLLRLNVGSILQTE